jgi:hypothetical protein
VLEQYLEDNAKPDAEREWGAPEEAEVMLPAFIERAKRLRMQILCKKAERLARGSEIIYDKTLKKKRNSTYADGIGQLHRLLQFDLVPESNGGGTGILPVASPERLALVQAVPTENSVLIEPVEFGPVPRQNSIHAENGAILLARA